MVTSHPYPEGQFSGARCDQHDTAHPRNGPPRPQVAGLNEDTLAQRTGYTIDLIRTVLNSRVDTRPLVEI